VFPADVDAADEGDGGGRWPGGHDGDGIGREPIVE
jgi:hypothetical protein